MLTEIQKAEYLPNQKPPEWTIELRSLIDRFNHLNIDGTVAAKKVQKDRETFLLKLFRQLKEEGRYSVAPRNINQKHVMAACRLFERDGLSPATIETYISYLKIFCIWIGKPGMIHDYKQYLSEGYPERKVVMAAADNPPAINLQETLFNIKQTDPYIWQQLLLQVAFGLSRKEAVMLRPAIAQRGGMLLVSDGTGRKGMREIAIDDEFKVQVLSTAQDFVKGSSSDLRVPGMNAEKSMKRFSNRMNRSGLSRVSQDELKLEITRLLGGVEK